MKGVVDDSGRAILPIKILCPKYPTGVQIDTWIDTGFTGDLVLPQIVIDEKLGECPRLAYDGLAPHLVPGTDLGPLFSSIRPGSAPSAWHRFRAPVC
jgi:hypothetical protein